MDRILLAAPRGFCAGVAYAIEVVDLALKIHGPPIYVRHAIVHNEWVVKSFEDRGVVFVEDVEDVPENMPAVFSAHGVSPAVREAAKKRNLQIIDATCPLVTKVHNEAKRYAEKGYFMIFIGHAGHVEAEGTMGEAPGRIVLVDGPEEAEKLVLPNTQHPAPKPLSTSAPEHLSTSAPEHLSTFPLAVLTQTTLSVDEVQKTLAVLKRRFPHLETPQKEDICYATTNRQAAVRELAKKCGLVLIVGSKTSSNSNRLREVAESLGAEAHLIATAAEIKPEWRTDFPTVGVSSGASTPEHLVEEVIGELIRPSPSDPRPSSLVPRPSVEILETVKEDVKFLPPRELIQLAMRA